MAASELETRLSAVADAYKRSPKEAAKLIIDNSHDAQFRGFFRRKDYQNDPRFKGFEILKVLKEFTPDQLHKIGPKISAAINGYVAFTEKHEMEPWTAVGLKQNFSEEEFKRKRNETGRLHTDKGVSPDDRRLRLFNDAKPFLQDRENRDIIDLYHAALKTPTPKPAAPKPAAAATPKPGEKPAAAPPAGVSMSDEEARGYYSAMMKLAKSANPDGWKILDSLTKQSGRVQERVQELVQEVIMGINTKSMTMTESIEILKSLTSDPDYLRWLKFTLDPFVPPPSAGPSAPTAQPPKAGPDHSALIESMRNMITDKKYAALSELRGHNKTVSLIVDKLEENVPDVIIKPLLDRLLQAQPKIYQQLQSACANVQATPRPGGSSETPTPKPAAATPAGVNMSDQEARGYYSAIVKLANSTDPDEREILGSLTLRSNRINVVVAGLKNNSMTMGKSIETLKSLTDNPQFLQRVKTILDPFVPDHSTLIASMRSMITHKKYAALSELRGHNKTVSLIVDKLEENVPDAIIRPLLDGLLQAQPKIYQQLQSACANVQATPRPGSPSRARFFRPSDPVNIAEAERAVSIVLNKLYDYSTQYFSSSLREFARNPDLSSALATAANKHLQLEKRGRALEELFESRSTEYVKILREDLSLFAQEMNTALQKGNNTLGWRELCKTPEFRTLLEKTDEQRLHILIAYGASSLAVEDQPDISARQGRGM